MTPIKFCPLSSGSAGNCVFIGSHGARLLIDAGLSAKRIENALTEIGEYGKDLSAIFITHEHSDHIAGVGVLARRYSLPVYATAKTWRYFERHGTIGPIASDVKKILEPGVTVRLADFEVTAFDIPHDASAPVGYRIQAGDKKISVATDIGHVTDDIRKNIEQSDVLLLESNHDLEMLRNGRYPKILKDRIDGSRGHLSNADAGQLIAQIISDKLHTVYLGHLSEENNRPLIALDTVETILRAHGKRLPILRVASREGISETTILS